VRVVSRQTSYGEGRRRRDGRDVQRPPGGDAGLESVTARRRYPHHWTRAVARALSPDNARTTGSGSVVKVVCVSIQGLSLCLAPPSTIRGTWNAVPRHRGTTSRPRRRYYIYYRYLCATLASLLLRRMTTVHYALGPNRH